VTAPSGDPQPQPVLNITRIGGLIQGAIVAVGGVAVIVVGGIGANNLDQFAAAVGIAVTAVLAVVMYVIAVIHGRHAAAQVTPLDSPQDAHGHRLIPESVVARDPNPWERDLERWIAQLREQSTPSGIHAHPTKKLGKRPTDPNRPVLRMGTHFTAAAFTAPASVDYASRVPSWLLGANDKFGTCGPTSVANLALLVSTLLADAPVTFTDDEIFDLYRRSGNPDFDPATGKGDGGVDMTVMLSELVKNGIGSGARNVKAVAFGSVDPHDTAKLWAAGCLFGGVLWGADLDVAQQAQTDAGLWDYKPSSTWGGHAILSAPAYSDQPGTLADRTKLVTWAELIAATDTFIGRQVSECYVVLFPWHLGDRRIYEALDMQGVAAEYQQLTGRPFPAPVQPPTPQPPAPAPGPAPAPSGFPLAAWKAFANHPYSRPKEKAAVAAVNAWLAGDGA
jgi:hypothetical protein